MKKNDIKNMIKIGTIAMLAGIVITASGLILDTTEANASTNKVGWIQQGNN